MNSMIQTVDLTKKFNDFVANDHINLDVKEQEIKCIVGENGAGKSTMMNMLYGLLQPTSGKILIRGKEVTLNSPVDAIANGIGMVHQHFKLVPSLTVYENILLGAEITQKKGGMKTPFIDQKEEIKRVEKLIQENHLELNASGALSGVAGAGWMLSDQFKYTLTFSANPGLGWDGMLIALLGGHSPIGILIAAIFYAALKTGSDSINMYTAVPKEIVAIIQGMIILFLAVKFIGDKTSVFSRFKKAKKEDA